MRSGRGVYSAALVLVALTSAWMGYAHGGYYVETWGVAAAILAVLMFCAAILGVLGGARSWWSVAATSLFIGYAAWTFASIAWSPNRGDAWFGAGLTLSYLLVFWISATLVALNASRRWALAALAIGPGVVAAITIPMIGSSADGLFESSRLLGTVGYFNAEAAFLLISFWAGIYVAGSKRIHPALRAAALASIVVGVELAVLTQSRGAMVSLAVSLPVFFIVSGQRLRGLIAFLPVLGALFFTFPGLNEVYLDLENTGSGAGAVASVTPLVWATAAGAGIYGLAWGILDRRWRPSPELAKAARIAAFACVAIGVVVGSLVFVDRLGSPVAWGEERWEAFVSDDMAGDDESRYMSAGGSGRYTLWQVAGRDFAANPILGVGTHNYEATYYQDRDSVVGWIRQPHMLPLEVLSERGIVGGLFFFGFLGTCVAAGLWKHLSDLNSEGKAQVGAVLASVVYWLTHSSVEWFWQMPAVMFPAMVYMAMLVAPWNRLGDEEEPYAPSDRPLKLAGVGIVVLTLAVVSPLYVADRFHRNAEAEENPWVALSWLELAQSVNPLDPVLAREEGDLALRIGDIPRSTRAYARAIRLNPEHYASYAVLGSLYEQVGQNERAVSLYQESLQLNPLDPELQENVERAEEKLSGESANSGD